MMPRFFLYLSILSSFVIVSLAFSAGAKSSQEFYCTGKEYSGLDTFLRMSQDSDKTYHFSTETTSKYLLGLSCEFPTESPLLFRCGGDQSIQLNFFSQHVVEEGYDAAYSRYTKKDFLKFTISYYYVNNLGEDQQVLSTRSYLLADCIIK